ncbi:MAG: helix-turn-helix transcriptional regulator [Anaerolineae bacterium]|nr:helix-turn-helix transcriptional regulator [Anaerolineae bacterium]
MIDLNMFGKDVRRWRTGLKLRQSDVADLAFCTKATISLLENARRNGLRMQTYNCLAALVKMEPRLMWWDYRRTAPGVYARGRHDADLFRGLCIRRWGGLDEVLVDGLAMELRAELFDRGPVRHGYLFRLPGPYGYQLEDAPKQGAFEATVMCL